MATTFTCFSNLPVELRLKIWGFAVFPRTISLLNLVPDVYIWHDGNIVMRSVPPLDPPVLLVNHEARKETMRFYTVCAISANAIRNMRKHKLLLRFRMNFDLDTLEVDDKSLHFTRKTIAEFSGKIKHVRAHLEDEYALARILIDLYNSFHKLRDAYIALDNVSYATGHWPSLTEEETIEMEIGSLSYELDDLFQEQSSLENGRDRFAWSPSLKVFSEATRNTYSLHHSYELDPDTTEVDMIWHVELVKTVENTTSEAVEDENLQKVTEA